MTKQDLIARQSKLSRSATTGAIGFLVAFFAIIIGNVFLGSFVDRHHPPLAVLILYGAFAVAFFVGAIAFLSWSRKRRERRFGLVCPVCHKTISGVLAHIAVASDRCGYCGSPVFSDDQKA